MKGMATPYIRGYITPQYHLHHKQKRGDIDVSFPPLFTLGTSLPVLHGFNVPDNYVLCVSLTVYRYELYASRKQRNDVIDDVISDDVYLAASAAAESSLTSEPLGTAVHLPRHLPTSCFVLANQNVLISSC